MRRLIWKAPLIIALMSFAVWWQWRQEAKKNSPGKSPVVSAEIIQRLTGSWQAEVDYPSRGKFIEQFLFQPEGSTLFGTASYLALKHGIEDGRVEGEHFSFIVRYQEIAGDSPRDHKIYYWGMIVGNEIRLRMQDDQGSPPLEWNLIKNNFD